jgi:hypothetical protein
MDKVEYQSAHQVQRWSTSVKIGLAMISTVVLAGTVVGVFYGLLWLFMMFSGD